MWRVSNGGIRAFNQRRTISLCSLGILYLSMGLSLLFLPACDNESYNHDQAEALRRYHLKEARQEKIMNEQNTRYDKQLDLGDEYYRRIHELADREDRLLDRREEQADKYDVILDRWAAQSAGKTNE